MTLVASALPVRMPRGATWTVSTATLMAATILGGPTAGAWVGALGPTEIRETPRADPLVRDAREPCWIVAPASGRRARVHRPDLGRHRASDGPVGLRRGHARCGALFLALNAMLTAIAGRASHRATISIEIIRTEARGIATSIVGIAPLGWLMAQMYTVAWWASLLFALPLYTTRLAYHNFVEMREMFTQTIRALAGAVDKRDPYTSKHSRRVKEIAGDIGRVMRLSVAELEALEWGGLLHDVGKIGVPDNVLLKQERLNKEERMIMNAHPVLGAQIIAPGHPAGARAADHPPPPRVVQRLGLPGSADRRRDPAARPDPPRGRRVRGDDGPAPVPDDAADGRAGARRAAQVRRRPVRPAGRRCVRQDALGRGA